MQSQFSSCCMQSTTLLLPSVTFFLLHLLPTAATHTYMSSPNHNTQHSVTIATAFGHTVYLQNEPVVKESCACNDSAGLVRAADVD